MTDELKEPEAGTDENAGLHPFLLDLMSRIEMEPVFKNERGLLYKFRGERLYPDSYGGAVKTTEYDVLIKHDAVTLRTVTETCGVNRKSNKIYRNWKTERSLHMSLRAEKYGHRVLRFYENVPKSRKYKGSFMNVTSNFSDDYLEIKPGITNSDNFAAPQSLPSVPSFRQITGLRNQAINFSSWVLHQIFLALDPTNPAFLARSFGSAAAYPVLQMFPKSEFNITGLRECLPKNYSLHSELDVKKFITKAFGSEGHRKDMVKAVVNTTNLNAIFLLRNLKELFPLDWLRDVMKTPTEYVIYNPKEIYTERATAGLHSLLAYLTLPQRKRLLLEKLRPEEKRNELIYKQSIHDRHRDIRDALRMFNGLNPEQREEHKNRIDYSSWSNLHDTLIQLTNELRMKEDARVNSTRIEWGETYMALLNDTSYEVDGVEYLIRSPKHRHDLNRWGNEMHNCIASYHYQVIEHSTNVFGIYTKEGLFANVEINNSGQIMQHMQKYNSPSPNEHIDAMSAHIGKVHEEYLKRKADENILAEQQDKVGQKELAMA